MSERIGHQLLDLYEGVNGELEKLPKDATDPELWEIIDQLLLDLHMIRFGYVSEGYEKYVERRLEDVCTDRTVVDRIKGMRL